MAPTRSKVGPLIRIDALGEDSTHEWNGVVLVVTFAVAQNGIAGKFHAEFGLASETKISGSEKYHENCMAQWYDPRFKQFQT